MRRFAAVLTGVMLLPLTGAADNAVKVEIREWKVPYEASRPRDPYVDQKGFVWFVGQRSHYVGLLHPDSGEFKKFDLVTGAGPHNLIVGKDGYVWYAGNQKAHIGRLDPRSGDIKIYPMPDGTPRDPHTLVFDGTEENIWFTAQGGNTVGRLQTRTGKLDILPVPTERARPYGIKVDQKGHPWVVLLGTNKIATVDPATMALKEITLPRAETRPRRVEIDSKGNIWYVDFAGGRVGVYEAATGKVEEWISPGGEKSRPYGTAMDNADRFWFVETGAEPNQFVGFDTRTRQFIGSTPIPSGGGTVRYMFYNAPKNEIWFGADTNTIGRAILPPRSAT